ncbi:MAG: hypothetical protein A3I11_08580 [Elusimicrobia bacterium RIFCSPLOWO2_02_FULL_39_32]|nr:MAG: hypothetical protein A3B80_08845 [Elusimicrobia bacterium RIFCSPHIGHO2_02_FULL_39_36]OGR93223.1 MAG: hypothetical protein A3I11_08580 [Elusimicrobia bacterium RIFCSPLOWO2_02_FULL_39_32]
MQESNKPDQNHSIKFGTDGWRGIIAENFTFQNVHQVTHAVAKTFQSKKKDSKKIFVGYDHRFIAKNFAKEVIKNLISHGYKAELLPFPVSSPYLSYVTWLNKSPFGVILTASHNPPKYLGFKIKGSFGGSMGQETIDLVEKNLHSLQTENDFQPKLPKLEKTILEIKESKDFIESYINYLKNNLEIGLLIKSKKILTIDPLYGSACKIADKFFNSLMKKSKIKTHFIHNKIDPLFGGLNPEPIEKYLDDLKMETKRTGSLVGFALDGDGDRLGVIDEKGNYLTPCQVFALLTYYLLSEKKLKGTVVQSVSLGYLTSRIARDFNCIFEEVPVGFKYLTEKLLKGDVLAAGEESGGYAFSQTKKRASKGTLLPERDGLFSALLFLEMTLKMNKPVSQILGILQKKYGFSNYNRQDVHLANPIEDREGFIKKLQNNFPRKWFGLKVREIKTLDGLKITFENDSWILVRPSGTESLLRTYAEFENKTLTDESLKKIFSLVTPLIQ